MIHYWTYWIAAGGSAARRGGALHRDGPYATGHEAKERLRERLRSGQASLACVAVEENGEITPQAGSVEPQAARKIITHWEAIWAATEPPKGE